MSDEYSKLIYSTGISVLRSDKTNKKTHLSEVPSVRRKVTVRLDRKRRGGKVVTVIEGIRISPEEMEDLFKQLKTKLGTGGTVRETSLEIQGDHRDIVIEKLKEKGYSPKRPGG